jgi:hypothetical protein
VGFQEIVALLEWCMITQSAYRESRFNEMLPIFIAHPKSIGRAPSIMADHMDRNKRGDQESRIIGLNRLFYTLPIASQNI